MKMPDPWIQRTSLNILWNLSALLYQEGKTASFNEHRPIITDVFMTAAAFYHPCRNPVFCETQTSFSTTTDMKAFL